MLTSTHPRPPRGAPGPPHEPGEDAAPGKYLIAPSSCQLDPGESHRPGRAVKSLMSDVRGWLETLMETQVCFLLPPAQVPAGPWRSSILLCQHRPPSLRLSRLPVWQPGIPPLVAMPGFHGEPGPGAESCYLLGGVRSLKRGRNPGPMLSAPCPHRLLLAGLPLGTRDDVGTGGTSKSLFCTFYALLKLDWRTFHSSGPHMCTYTYKLGSG